MTSCLLSHDLVGQYVGPEGETSRSSVHERVTRIPEVVVYIRHSWIPYNVVKYNNEVMEIYIILTSW